MKEYRCYVEWLSIVVRRVSSYACKSLVTLNVGVVVSEHVMTVDLPKIHMLQSFDHVGHT